MSVDMQDIEEIKNDVSMAFKTVLYSMDYRLLKIILDTSQKATDAVKHQLFAKASYYINLGFWEIGEYLHKKMDAGNIVTNDFFNKISNNISRYLKVDKKFAFSPENLQRCYKVVDLVKEETFLSLAEHFNWGNLTEIIDKSFDEEGLLNLVTKNYGNNASNDK